MAVQLDELAGQRRVLNHGVGKVGLIRATNAKGVGRVAEKRWVERQNLPVESRGVERDAGNGFSRLHQHQASWRRELLGAAIAKLLSAAGHQSDFVILKHIPRVG